MLENLKTDKDILDFLMTSEFLEDEFKPSELRVLLLKFRWFYRSSHAKQESMKNKIDSLENKISSLESEKVDLSSENDKKDIKYDKVVNRKLSFKERITGNIYENKSRRKIRLFKK
jgi:hypothetical protein